MSRLAVVLSSAALFACGPARPPAPALPAGIAALQLGAGAEALRRIAADEDEDEDEHDTITRRREVLRGLNRQLLMSAPSDANVPELFDFVTAMAPRMESGEIPATWASYLYTVYQRDLLHDRPDGRPRRSREEVAKELAREIEFFHIGARAPADATSPTEGDFDATRQWREERRRAR